MLRHELKKLFLKNYGIFALLLTMIFEMVYLGLLYPQMTFASDIDRQHFEEYISEFSGKLTPEKEQAILAEQELIIDAHNAEQTVLSKLTRGEFATEEEFNAEMDEISAVTERRTAFNMLLTKYYFAAENPENRYITEGDYSGFAADQPDVFLILLVILMTAALFLNEESSHVATYIRITKNGKAKTLRAKIISLVIMTFAAQLFRVCAEFCFICSRGKFDELLFPLQSLDYFGYSEYDMSILGAFFAVSAIRLLGYFFISALVMLLSVTLKKPLFTVFIPSAVCVLQQFLFEPATPAYYIPTGLLRAVGYLRGSDGGQTAEGFTAISSVHFTLILSFSTVFIIASGIAAMKYYGGISMNYGRKISAVISAFIMSIVLSGCSENADKNVIFNCMESMSTAQNSEYLFIAGSDGITAVSKSAGTRTQLLHDPFYSGEYFPAIMVCGDELYYHNIPGGLENYSVYKFSNDLRMSTVQTPIDTTGSLNSYDAGFLGLSLNANDSLTGVAYSFFTDGSNIYYIYLGGGIYSLNNGSYKCIIHESEMRDERKVSFDGRRIYYINKRLELWAYDLADEEQTRVSGGFVTTLYYDGSRLLYSNNYGIFAFDPADNSVEKLSSDKAAAFSSDGTNIVYFKEEALYLLGNDTPIYTSPLTSFTVVSGKLAVIYDTECTFVDMTV